MEEFNERYNDVIHSLRKSTPVLKNPGEIENDVMRIIRNQRRPSGIVSDLPEKIFGWVYVGWIRRTLVLASVCLVIVFVLQQSIILKKINSLEQRSGYIQTDYPRSNYTRYSGAMVSKIAGLRFLRSNKLTDQEIDRIINSYKDLEIKYNDILRAIDENPELRKYFNEKLPGFDKEKIKL